MLFDTFELTGSEVELAASMATFWTNFAKTGDPNLGFHLVADDAMQQQEEEQAQSRRRLEVAGGLASGEAAAVGTLPEQGWNYSGWNSGGSGQGGKEEPIPFWDGNNPAKNLKPWLRDLRMWRHETNLPASKHGLKLSKSFKYGSWMKTAADRVPEEQLVADQA